MASIKSVVVSNLLFAYVFLIAGCSSIPTTTPLETRESAALERDYFDVDIPTHDGMKLRATVFQPELAPGETAPLIVHAHGFGVFRMPGPLSIYGLAIYSGVAAKQAWENKYWVISYDERGHGQSDGMIRVMDPDFEVKDVSTIVDWATANIGRISKDERNDPEIGMIGESYGGGAQLMGAVTDPRIDALIPITTWNSFQSALTPGHVPKSGWLTTLITVGNSLNPGNMEPILNRAYWEARSGKISNEIFEFLAPHSPRYNCEHGVIPQADILFVQGMRDVLFPLNEAKENYDCMSNGEHDVRLIATQGGHLLPMTQWSLIPGYEVEGTIHCDNKTIDLSDMAVDWFDEKLKHQTGKADYIPNICITQDYDSGTSFATFPKATDHHRFAKVSLNDNFTGLFEVPMGMLDTMSGWLIPRMKSPALADHAKTDATMRPAFVPLRVAKRAGVIAGIPAMNVELDALDPEDEPTVFMGVAVKRASTRKIELISDQVTPLRGNGMHTGDMAGISTRIYKDDIIGLWIGGYSNQYRFSGGDWFSASEVHGEVTLPDIYTSAPTEVATHP